LPKRLPSLSMTCWPLFFWLQRMAEKTKRLAEDDLAAEGGCEFLLNDRAEGVGVDEERNCRDGKEDGCRDGCPCDSRLIPSWVGLDVSLVRAIGRGSGRRVLAEWGCADSLR
jgi:hypothetical protein